MPYMFPVVIAKGLSFSYSPGGAGVEAADLSLDPGAVHAVVGLSGSGKSTLADLLSGRRPARSGTLHYQGKLTDPRAYASEPSIRYIGRPRNLDPHALVVDCLELEGVPTHFGIRDMKAAKKQAEVMLSMRGLPNIAPDAPMIALSAGQQRLLESAVAISKPTTLLVLDDPAAALTEAESTVLYQHISTIVRAGAAAVYLTSDAEEALAVGDRISVLRDGRLISDHDPEGVFVHQLEGEMLGREVPAEPPRKPRFTGPEVVFRIEGLVVEHCVFGLSLAVKRGEVLGLLGLDGAGQSEVVRAIGCDMPRRDGEMFLNASATPTRVATRQQALTNGLGFVPDPLGLAPGATLNPQRGKVNEALTGGGRLMLFDNPTRGLNLNNRLDTYKLISALADAGHGIVISSRDPEELIRLCDRIQVMANGRVIGHYNYGEFSVERLRRQLKAGK